MLSISAYIRLQGIADEDKSLSNSAADRRPCFSQRLVSWRAAALGVVVVLALWGGVNCQPSWAQASKRPSASDANHLQAQQGPEVRSTTTTKIQQSSTDHRVGKSVTGNSKNEDNQTPFGSLGSNNRGPINIQSDSLALDYKKNIVQFIGHVHATQADGVLTSNTLNVKYGKDFHEVEHMDADGSVHISQGVRWCTSDHAVMDQQQHTVILTGTPICHDASDQIAGTRITVHLDTGKSDVEGAKAVIFPQTSKTRDNEPMADQTK
jgi:lipopolysaccharide export system protein LptA